MSDYLTPADLVAEGARVLTADLDPDGTNPPDLAPGSDLTTFLSTAAGMLTPLLGHVSERVASVTLSGARGADLDVVAQDLFQAARKPAAYSTGVVYLQRQTTAAATTIPLGSRFAVPADGSAPAVQFAASGTVSVAAGVAKVAVPIACTQPGADGNVAPETVTRIVDALPDSGWAIFVPSVANPGPSSETAPAALGGGADAESDEELIARLRALPLDASRKPGTAAGVLYAATSVAGVASALVVETMDGMGSVFVGDEAGALPDALRVQVTAAVEDYRGLGVPLRILGYDVQDVDVAATVYMQRDVSSYDVQSLKSLGESAVQRYFDDRIHDDEVIASAIGAAIAEAIDDEQGVRVDAPVEDILRRAPADYAAQGSIPRYRVGTVTITIANPRTA